MLSFKKFINETSKYPLRSSTPIDPKWSTITLGKLATRNDDLGRRCKRKLEMISQKDKHAPVRKYSKAAVGSRKHFFDQLLKKKIIPSIPSLVAKGSSSGPHGSALEVNDEKTAKKVESVMGRKAQNFKLNDPKAGQRLISWNEKNLGSSFYVIWPNTRNPKGVKAWSVKKGYQLD